MIAYVVDRYGEFVLLKPRFSYRNALLWGAPVILLLVGGVLIVTAHPDDEAMFFVPTILGNVIGGVALVAAVNYAQVAYSDSDRDESDVDSE